MLGRNLIGFLIFLLTLPPSDATIKKLNTIQDLKSIPFGKSVPAHSLVLLHWFANTIEFDNNNAIELTFEADGGDYGTHHYGNYEQLLEPVPRGHVYYTLGNLNHLNNQGNVARLPSYFTGRLENLMVYEEPNRDRIIFRLRNRNSESVDRVYITQHYEANQQRGTMYDPDNTYQITGHLLRQLRLFSLDQRGLSTMSELRDDFGHGIDNQQLRYLRNLWGELACLGLLVFIVINEKNLPRRLANKAPAPQPPQPLQINLPPRPNRHPSQNLPHRPTPRARETPDTIVNMPEHTHWVNSMHRQVQNNVTLEVRAGKNGRANIYWSGLSEQQSGVMLVLFKSDWDTSEILHKHTRDSWGKIETSVALNKGLQVRLHEARRFCLCFTRVGEEISRGPEYHNAHAERQVSITGFDAMLNVFVKNGTACARLYIPEVRTDWENDFRESWVGFYTSDQKHTNQYETWKWQWATNFVEEGRQDSYMVYEYHSSVAVAPGVHARFIDRKGKEQARTPAWK